MAVDLSIAETANVKTKYDVASKAWANRLRKSTKRLAEDADRVFMELGKNLHVIWDTPLDGKATGAPLYEVWGFKSFKHYVESELGMDSRRAQRLRKIWYTLEVECEGIPIELKEKLISLGSSKLRELSRVLTTENAERWAEACKKPTVEQVRTMVTKALEDVNNREDLAKADPSEEEQPKPEIFRLFKSQRETLAEGIAAVRRITGRPQAKKGYCLDMIVSEFLMNNDVDLRGNRADYISKIEGALGIKLIGVDPETLEIVHGEEALQRLGEALEE